MIKRGKRGQFYLIAAIIIALVIFSLATISNYAKENTQTPVVFDLKNELNMETGKVVDFAIYNKSNTSLLIENWTKLYVGSQQGKDIENWVFVYGTPDNITILSFNYGKSGQGCLKFDNVNGCVYPNQVIVTKDTVTTTDNVTVTLGDFKYDFDIKSGQNFAFVIKKEGYVADSTVKTEKD